MLGNTRTQRPAPGAHLNRAADVQPVDLAAIFEHARRQIGYMDGPEGADGVPTYRVAKPAASAATLDLRAMLPRVASTATRPSVATTVRQSGESMTLAATVAAAARTVQAGAHLIVMEPPRLIDGAVPAFTQSPAGLRIVRPAGFEVLTLDPVTGEGEAAENALSDIVTEATIDRETDLLQHAFRVRVPRSTMKDLAPGVAEAEIAHAIALGLAEAADRCLLAALEAAIPAAPTGGFTFGKAAAMGLRWGDLAAIIGSNPAAGAAVNDAGALTVNGVAAEFVAAPVGAIIAAWSRFAIIMHPEVRVMAERLDATGALTVTCFADMAAVVPDAGFAWRGAA